MKSKPSPVLAKLGTQGKFLHALKAKEEGLHGEDKSSHLLPAYSVFLYNMDARHVSASGLMPVI